MNLNVSNTFFTGSSGISTVASSLAVANPYMRQGITIVPSTANSGTVYIGVSNSITIGSGLPTDGFPLSSTPLFLRIDNPSNIWLLADKYNNTVYWIGT